MELDKSFNEVVRIIDEARNNAYRKVNEELILMYSKIGQFLSEKSKKTDNKDIESQKLNRKLLDKIEKMLKKEIFKNEMVNV